MFTMVPGEVPAHGQAWQRVTWLATRIGAGVVTGQHCIDGGGVPGGVATQALAACWYGEKSEDAGDVVLARSAAPAGRPGGLVVQLDLTRLAEGRRPALAERTGVCYFKVAVLDADELLRQLIDSTDELRGVLVIAARRSVGCSPAGCSGTVVAAASPRW